MGRLAESVKAAAPAADAETSAFLSRLNKLEGQAAKPSTGEADLSHMTDVMGLPTAKQEMWQNTLRSLAKAGIGASQIGALLRALRAQSEEQSRSQLLDDLAYEGDVPGRGIRVPLGVKNAGVALPLALGAAATPVGARVLGGHISDLGGAIGEQGSKLKEHLFAQTGKATDNPWFYPLLLASILGGGYHGYKGLDTQLGEMRKQRAARSIAKAKKEFERALATQYEQSQLANEAGVKVSAHRAGMVADMLARAHVSGELDEQVATLNKLAAGTPVTATGVPQASQTAQPKQPWTLGLGNKALGIYMAALALLAAAGAGAGYHGVKSHETPRRKYETARELLRRRSLATPPIVTTEA